MHRDHFFDWHGFKFAAKLLTLGLVAGTLGRYGLLYAAQSGNVPPSFVLIQETRPAPPKSLSLSLSTTTSRHILNTLTVADVVPPTGKFIAIDFSTKVLTLYEEGAATAKYPILAESTRGSPSEISTGFYTVLAKEESRVQFYPNYFIHGVSEKGGLELATDDAEEVSAFVETGVGLFVYDPRRSAPKPSLALGALPTPSLSSLSYLVGDLDTGDIFLEQNASEVVPIASTTRVMLALAASEAIPLDTEVTVARGALTPSKRKTTRTEESFHAGDILAPLLMSSNRALASALAGAYGADGLVDWMNAKAKALDMRSTRFADAVGTSTESVSSAEDLFRLAAYLAKEKTFLLDALQTPDRELMADSGNVYYFNNETAASQTAFTIVPLLVNGLERRVAVVALKAGDAAADSQVLADWFTQSAVQGIDLAGTACATCAPLPPYRKIPL